MQYTTKTDGCLYSQLCVSSAGVRSVGTTNRNFPPLRSDHSWCGEAVRRVRPQGAGRSVSAELVFSVVYPDNKEIVCFLEWKCVPHHQKWMCLQDVDTEDFWEKLARESDPSRHQGELFRHTSIVPQLQSKIQAFKAQVTSKLQLSSSRFYLGNI